jgi:hypothetical protein
MNFNDSTRGRQTPGGVSDWGACRRCGTRERLKFTTHRGELVRLPMTCGHEPELKAYVDPPGARHCSDCGMAVRGQNVRCSPCRRVHHNAQNRRHHHRVQKAKRAAERTLGL